MTDIYLNVSMKNLEKGKTHISQAWLIWSIAGLFYLYEMILRVSPSVMTHELMQDLQISSTTLGILSSFYYYAYVIFQIPCGLFVDRFGPRKIVTLSAFLCVIGTILFAESTCLLTSQIGRFLIGAGSACAFISCLKVTAEWFNPAQFALIAGFTNIMGTLGATFGNRPLAMLVNSFGWRQAVFLTALAGIPIVLLAWILIKDTSPKQSMINQRLIAQPPIKLGQSLKIISMNKQIWLAGIIGGFMYLPISAFTELWAVPFFMNSYGINNELASTTCTMLIIGMAIGSPLSAWWAEKIQSHTKVMKLSTVTASVLFVAISYTQYFNIIIIFILLFVVGLTIGAEVLCFICAKNNSDTRISGTTMAFTNTLVMMSGVVFQPILGWILDFFWDGQMSVTGVRIYSHTCYQISILTIPVCLAFSWVLLRFLNDTYGTIKNKFDCD